MGKRIPDKVRGDAQYDGKQDSREPAKSAEPEVSELIPQSLLHSDGQQPYDWPLDGGVKHPQRENGSWKGEFDDTREVVAQASIFRSSKDIRKIWSHAAHQEGGPY